MRTLRVNCVDGITANTDRLAAQVETSVGVVTALAPYIGYAEASALAKKALLTHASISELVVDSGLMTREQARKLLARDRLAGIEPVTAAITVITPEMLAELGPVDAGTVPSRLHTDPVADPTPDPAPGAAVSSGDVERGSGED